MELAFKVYSSRFANGFDTGYQDNGYGTGSIMYVIPRYHSIEAVQNTNFNKDNLKTLIESKTALLSGIYMKVDSPYIMPINCKFDSSNYNPAYSITIYPGDYLIWDEVIHRFVVMQESVFLMFYKEALW